jgi:hypothetical protein
VQLKDHARCYLLSVLGMSSREISEHKQSHGILISDSKYLILFTNSHIIPFERIMNREMQLYHFMSSSSSILFLVRVMPHTSSPEFHHLHLLSVHSLFLLSRISHQILLRSIHSSTTLIFGRASLNRFLSSSVGV